MTTMLNMPPPRRTPGVWPTLDFALAGLLWAVCLAGLGAAEGQAVSDPAQAMYRVSVAEGQGVVSHGSAIAVHPRLLLTNSHVVGHRLPKHVRITQSARGLSFTGQVEGIDPQRDLAIIYVQSAQVDWVALADADPIAGSPCVAYGYGGNVRLEHRRGRIIECASFGRGHDGHTWRYVAADFGLRDGDSGGGLFVNNRLVAVNWGTTLTRTEARATPIVEVRRFLTWWQTRHPQGRQFHGGCFPPRGEARPRPAPAPIGWQPAPPPAGDSFGPPDSIGSPADVGCPCDDELEVIDRRLAGLEDRFAQVERRLEQVEQGSFLLRIYDAETGQLIDEERVSVFGGTMNLKIYRIHADR